MQENEISLKELILILLNGWKWIVGTILFCLVISLMILSLFNSTTYKINLNGTLVKADVYETTFGAYPAHTVKNSDLINLVNSEEYRNYIANIDNSITSNTTLTDTGEFTISLNSNEISSLKNISGHILENFESFVNFNLQERAIKYFLDTNLVSINRNAVTVENNNKLIETLTQKLTSIDRLIAPDIINPEYNVFSSQRASVEYETIRLQFDIDKISKNQTLLKELTSNNFDTYLKNETHLDGMKVSINFNSTNYIQELRRFNQLTLVPISVILGGMLGVFIVFFHNYWKNN